MCERGEIDENNKTNEVFLFWKNIDTQNRCEEKLMDFCSEKFRFEWNENQYDGKIIINENLRFFFGNKKCGRKIMIEK